MIAEKIIVVSGAAATGLPKVINVAGGNAAKVFDATTVSPQNARKVQVVVAGNAQKITVVGSAGPDVTAPTVVGFSPVDNATNVAITTDLVATMSETVVLGAAGLITLKKTSDNSVIQTWNVSTQAGSGAGQVNVVGGNQLTMRLTASLANTIEYYVIWDAGVVKDLANNPVAAQASTTLWSFTTAAGSFTGLLDVLGVSATRAYSTRKLRAAYAGSAIRIRRSSDNAEQDIGFSGENLDTAAITTFVGANSAYVVKMYDQSGGAADAIQATVTQQARVVNAGVLETRSGKVTPFFDGTDDRLDAAAAAWSVKTASAVVAVNEAGPGLSHAVGILSSITSSYIMVAQSGASGYYGAYSVDGGSQAAPYILFGGRLHSVRYTDPTGWSTSEVMAIGTDRGFGNSCWTGWIGEVVIFATQLSAPNYATLYQNQGAYWLSPPLLLDVLGVSATRAYSTRKLRAAYAGSAIRIRRSSDNAEQDIGFVGENLDYEALLTFAQVGPGSGGIVKWYDQSGSADDCVQATVAMQALAIAGGTITYRNGKPTALFDGVDDEYVGTSGYNVWTGSAVAAINNAGPNFPNYNCISGRVDGNAIEFCGTIGSTAYIAGSFTTLAVNNGANVCTFGGTLMQVYGTRGGTTSSPVALQVGSNADTANRWWPGWIAELVYIDSNVGNSAMYTNQKTYWGTP